MSPIEDHGLRAAQGGGGNARKWSCQWDTKQHLLPAASHTSGTATMQGPWGGWNCKPGREAQPCYTMPQPGSCLWGLFQLNKSSMMRSKCDQRIDLHSPDLTREDEVKLSLSNLCKLTTNGVIQSLSQHWKKYLLFLSIKLTPLWLLFIKSTYKFALHKKGNNSKTSYELWSNTFVSKKYSCEKKPFSSIQRCFQLSSKLRFLNGGNSALNGIDTVPIKSMRWHTFEWWQKTPLRVYCICQTHSKG